MKNGLKQKMKYNENNSFFLKYKSEIEAGNIIVGKELYKELCNLYDDMIHNDDYFYDTKKSNLRIDFMENCIKLTKSPYYNKPMIMMLWQKAFVEVLYSFKLKKEMIDNKKEIDRFKKALLLIARKNTKSELCAALGNSEFILGNPGSDLVCSSNDDSQSSIVYDGIDTMRQLYDFKDRFTKRNIKCILNKTNNTKIIKLSDRTRNKEGRNIDWAILDEAHEMKNNIIAKSIEQSQSLKDNPKFIIITTEGFVIDGYLDGEIESARKIIKKEDDSIYAKRYLPWLYTQDSENEIFQNKNTWYKSNPTLGKIKRFDYLEEQVDIAKRSKADRIFVLSKDFNIKQNSVEYWLNEEDYYNEKKFSIEDLRGSYCIGHVDLSETTDLCCAKAMIVKDKVKYILTMYFIPESKLLKENNDSNAGAKYSEWAKKGLITICEGNENDLTLVADWFYKLKRDYNISLYKCGYDQRFCKDFLSRMEEYGWSKKYGDMEMILQDAKTLNNAILLLEADFKSKYVVYNDNDVDKWCLSNSCLKLNNLRQALIVKSEPSKKIDGAVCLASLYEVYRRYKKELYTINTKN